MSRLVPRTLKGKIQAALFAPWAALAAALVLLVVFWPWLSYALAALFALVGALAALAALAAAGYVVWRRRKLAALRVDWSDADAETSGR